MVSRTSLKKIQHAEVLIKQHQRVIVALSGGVDSGLLLAIAQKTIPGRVIAVTISSPLVSPDEIKEARRIARETGVPHIVSRVALLKNRKLVSNSRSRCYICKHYIFRHIRRIAHKHHAAIMEASNYSDIKDFRPGLQALKELKILSPFINARITKSEIRFLARKHGLAVWNKPANACLATRIPYGTRITPALLTRIDRAERYLRRLGIRLVRVRDHSSIARIEVPSRDFPHILGQRTKIARYFHTLGYTHIVLDLEGYQTGSLN